MRRSLVFLFLVVLGSACGRDSGLSTDPPTTPPGTAGTSVPAGPTTAPPASVPVGPTTAPGTTIGPLQGFDLERVAANLERPVWVGAPPGDERLFIVEQPGRILLAADGDLSDFLDLRQRVRSESNEQGLLGVAFHPDYAANGRLFVHYTDLNGDTVVSEFAAADGTADPDSERMLLEVEQPAPNHNGGMIAFGPDGYLYIGLGDGGASNDRFGNGQRPDTLLGSMLRIDVDNGDPYAIPPDNPFADGRDGAPEVWAYGLRNPWRFWFDDGLLYIGDVGQGDVEEIDIVPALAGGVNFGWPILEGTECFQTSSCDRAGTEAPVLEYRHTGGACSVTGGVVYRGTAIPELNGHYLYGDFCAGWVRSFLFGDGPMEDRELFAATGALSSFGVDGAGEVYLTLLSGEVLRIIPIR